MLTSKVKTAEEATKPPQFPILGQHYEDSYVVLFTKENEGTVVHQTPDNFPLGYFSDNWSNLFGVVWKILPKDTEITLKVE